MGKRVKIFWLQCDHSRPWRLQAVLLWFPPHSYLSAAVLRDWCGSTSATKLYLISEQPVLYCIINHCTFWQHTQKHKPIHNGLDEALFRFSLVSLCLVSFFFILAFFLSLALYFPLIFSYSSPPLLFPSPFFLFFFVVSSVSPRFAKMDLTACEAPSWHI